MAKEKKARKSARKGRLASSEELLCRAEAFLSLLSFSLAAFYVVGAWQSFMDSTLSLILSLLSLVALATASLAVIVIAKEAISSICKRRRLSFLVIAFSLFFLLSSLLLLISSHALIAVSEGF